MRRALGKLCGRTCRFLAIVKFIGYKRQTDRCDHQLSVLLVNVRVAGKSTSKRITDHVWVPLSKTFTESKVKRGLRIEFCSTVIEYYKWQGSNGDRERVKEFGLDHVSNLKILGMCHKN